MPVDFNNGVINIDEDVPTSLIIAGGWGWDQCWGLCGQVGQKPGGHSIELADMPEGKRPKEGPQGGWGVDPIEESAHTAVAQLVHIVNRVGTGDQ